MGSSERRRAPHPAWILFALIGILPLDARAAHAFFDSLQLTPERYPVVLERSVMVAMRDGVKLSTDIYRPAGLEGRLPVVMIRTPYDKRPFRLYTEARSRGGGMDPQVKYKTDYDPYVFASRGYVVIVQDHRGRYESEGEFFPYPRTDGQDGYDTISWVVGQPWASGKVGTVGCSYLGETQHMLASQRHPHHTTAIAMAGSSSPAPGGVLSFGFMRYGVLKLAGSVGWNELTLRRYGYGPPPGVDRQSFFQSEDSRWYAPGAVPPRTAEERLAALSTLPSQNVMTALYGSHVPTAFEEWLAMGNEPGGDYWRVRQGIITDADRFDVPTLHVDSWYNGTPAATLDLLRLFTQNAESERARNNQFLIMSPATHCRFEQMTRDSIVGDRPLGDAYLNFRALYLAWFDHWLRDADNGITRMPKVSSFAMGKGEWRTAPQWPLPGTVDETWFLASGALGANSRNGDGVLRRSPYGGGRSRDEYLYDPLFPAPAVGGGFCCLGPAKGGGVDQRTVELRNDVLVYTSAPLREPVEVAGQIVARLFVSSSAKDTDFIVKLVDVYPDGTAYIVHEGILRARWREGFAKPVWLGAGEVVPIAVPLEATHNYFGMGHRIRIDVTSSSFPMWERNLNTGGPNYSESAPVVARNAIHHSSRYPSALSVPVVHHAGWN